MTEDKCLKFDFQFYFETHKSTKHQPKKLLLFPFNSLFVHSRTVIHKALGDNSPAGANHSTTSEVNPARHPHWPCKFAKQAHPIKKLTPVASPLSHCCLLFLTTQINHLFPFPEISRKFCCDKRVFILDWPHQFPRCETAQI